MSNDVTEILKGFKVPQETMWELKQYFDKRPKFKISETLSKEAKLAIQQTKEEFLLKREDFIFSTGQSGKRQYRKEGLHNKSGREIKGQTMEKMTKKTTFSETYNKSHSSHMEDDIIISGNGETVAISNNNENIKMETTHIPSDTKKKQRDNDDLAIAETAKLNAVEKCMVWMAVNGGRDSDRSTASHSTTSGDK